LAEDQMLIKVLRHGKGYGAKRLISPNYTHQVSIDRYLTDMALEL